MPRRISIKLERHAVDPSVGEEERDTALRLAARKRRLAAEAMKKK
jgi:hypothetical protein